MSQPITGGCLCGACPLRNHRRAAQHPCLSLPCLPEGDRRRVLCPGHGVSRPGKHHRSGRLASFVAKASARLLPELRHHPVLRAAELQPDRPGHGKSGRSRPFPADRTHLGVVETGLDRAGRWTAAACGKSVKAATRPAFMVGAGNPWLTPALPPPPIASLPLPRDTCPVRFRRGHSPRAG